MQTAKFLFFILLSVWNLQAWSQRWITVEKAKDTVRYSASHILLTRDTVYFSVDDSFAILKKGVKYRIRNNPYSKSELFYDSLQVKSYKNKVTRELYHTLIKSSPIEVQDTSNFDKSESVFIHYQGLKIRNIRLIKADVIEGSVYDTSVIAKSLLAKSANNFHIKSRNHVIYNNLTIHEGDLLDAIKLSDNERFLRSLSYIEDARIHILPVVNDSTQIDLLILTKDKFSIGIGFDYSGLNNFSSFLYDKNFFGFGHEMRNYLIYNNGYNPQYGYAFRYQLNNILNSFIATRFDYEDSWRRKYIGLSVNKEFLTQQTIYAGGINFYDISDYREYHLNDSVIHVSYKTLNQDYWIGRAFSITDNKATSFNISFRYANANFSRRPYVSADSNYFYHDKSLLLASFSIIKLNYYLSSLVYGFGVTEDIPYGYKMNILVGYERDQYMKRPYLGVGISLGKYYKYLGYLMFNFEYGSFYGNHYANDRVLKVRFFNIGNLHYMNRYSIRNFFDIDFQSGKNMSDPEFRAIINNRWSSIVSGLNKEGLKGEQKLTVNFESVLFTPWYLLGFKFAMLAYIDLGWVSQQQSLIKDGLFYGNIGIGARIKNESWVFETITLGIAWLVSAPEGSAQTGFIFDGSDPRQFRNLNPGKPNLVQMDQSPVLFLE